MSEYKIERTDKEIRDQLAKAEAIVLGENISQYPGKTYEEGVADTLCWLLGLDDESPIGDES